MIKLLQQKDNSISKLDSYAAESETFDRKVAMQERLERLSERLASEGHHEAAELMLGEKHIALGRCLARWEGIKKTWFLKWKNIMIEEKRRHLIMVVERIV